MNKRQIKITIAALCMCFGITVLVQAQSLTDGSVAAGMGHAGTALSGDHWAESNPSILASLDGRAFGLFASQAFGLGELRFSSIRFAQPTGIGTVGAGVSTFGFDDFRDTRFSVEYANGFSLGSTRTFLAGLRLRYAQLSIPDYGSASAIGISVGGLAALVPSVHLGFAATNLNQPEIAGSKMDRNLSAGIMYTASEKLRFAVDVIKEVRYPVSFRGGLEIRPVESLFLRTGATTNPTRFTAGAGFQVSRVAASFSSERHENLGWSPAAGLSVLW